MSHSKRALSIGAVVLASLAAALVPNPHAENAALTTRFIGTKYLFIL